MKSIAGILVLLAVLCIVHSIPDGYKHKKTKGNFQYINVPGPKEYEFGWNRGNPHHFISRFEQAKDHRFRTRVKWADSKDGHGEHYFEYNHGPKPGYKDHHEKHVDNHGGYGHDKSGYASENVEVFAPIEDVFDIPKEN